MSIVVIEPGRAMGRWAIKLTVGVDGISSLEKVYDVLDGVRGLMQTVSDEGADQAGGQDRHAADDQASGANQLGAEKQPGGIVLENAVVRRRGAQDWHIVFHAHGGHDVLTYAFQQTAPRHPELSATTVAFEEGRSVTVARHIPGQTEPVSTDRYPLEMYDTLEEEFRFHPTDAEALLLLPADVESITLEELQNRFPG
ncbi:MAG: hypothetical protein R6U25_05560 [Alkalispirochaeta sp.]